MLRGSGFELILMVLFNKAGPLAAGGLFRWQTYMVPLKTRVSSFKHVSAPLFSPLGKM